MAKSVPSYADTFVTDQPITVLIEAVLADEPNLDAAQLQQRLSDRGHEVQQHRRTSSSPPVTGTGGRRTALDADLPSAGTDGKQYAANTPPTPQPSATADPSPSAPSPQAATAVDTLEGILMGLQTMSIDDWSPANGADWPAQPARS